MKLILNNPQLLAIVLFYFFILYIVLLYILVQYRKVKTINKKEIKVKKPIRKVDNTYLSNYEHKKEKLNEYRTTN